MSAFAFVGRTHELKVLDGSLGSAAGGAGNCVVISGEAGIGKSRLIGEVRARARQRGFLVLEGRFQEPDRAVAYGGLATMLRNELPLADSAPVAGELGPPAHSLSRLLAELDLESLEASGGEGEANSRQQTIPEALASWLERKASRQPLLLTVEDLHCSDDASQECLTYLMARLRQVPLLLILSLRTPLPDPRMAAYMKRLVGAAPVRHLQLQPLKRQEVAAVMRGVSSRRTPIRFYYLEAVYGLTAGNPLFVEELCMASRATEAVSSKTDLLGLHPLPQAAIPRSVRRIIRQRVYALSEPAQKVADLCAVHPRAFDLELLEVLTGFSRRRLSELCEVMIRANLVMQTAERQFDFRHAMIRESLIDRLLIRERRALHAQLAAALETVYAGSLEVHLADLSYHAYEAGCWRRTLTYARQAGEQALALDAPFAAAAQFTRAIEAANRLLQAPSWELHCLRAAALERIGDIDGALTDYALALDSARVFEDRVAEDSVLQDLAALLPRLDLAHAGRYYRDIVRQAPGVGDTAV
ncbi:MAG TPA: BREX system ATP-binding domain-containing protein [Candidatus Binatia bacterium]|nr:BREX system ATP-binding domain-containing protein [Candidatus Binatia bacterium]